MNLKKIFLIGIFILILTITAVNAADENATQELTVEPADDMQMTDAGSEIGINEGDIEVIGPDELYYENLNRFDIKSKAGSGDGMVIAHVNNSTGTYANIYNSSEDSVTPLEIEIKEPGSYVLDFELLQNGNHYPLKTFNYNVSKFDSRIDYSFTVGDVYKELLVDMPAGASGTLEAIVGGKTDKRTVTPRGYISFDELGKINLGKNKVVLRFTADSKSKYKSQTLTKEIMVLPTIEYWWKVEYLSDKSFSVYAPGLTGIFNITIDGKHYKTVEVKDEAAVPASDLSIGKHSYIAEFISGEYSNSREGDFDVVPNFIVPDFVKEGEDNHMTVVLPDDACGNLVVLSNKKELYKNDNASGVIDIPLEGLEHHNTIDVNYTEGEFGLDDFFVVTCTKNSPNWDMKLDLESIISLDKDVNDNYFYLNIPDDYDGVIKAFIDGKEVYIGNAFNFTGYGLIDDKNYGNLAYTAYEFSIRNLKLGKHTLTVVADSSNYYKPVNRTTKFTATNMNVRFNSLWYDMENWDVNLPSGATGSLKFYVDGKLVDTQKGIVTLFRMPKNTKFGEHTLKFTYTGDKKYPKETITKKISYTYHYYPRYRNWLFFNDQQLVEGNKNILSFSGPSDFKGTVSITIAGEKISKKVNGGDVEFDLSKFKAGTYTVKVESSGSGKFTKQSYYLYDFEILPKVVNIKASANSIYYDGYYTIKVTYINGSAAKNVPVDILFGGYTYLEKTNDKGIVKIRIYEPKPGKCDLTITSKYSKVEKYVKVKHIVSLSSVKVKRSAKKLVLTAALKKGKTPISGKKVTFKFNGKVVGEVKTNSKGIAKVTIKSNVLKQLKVGKKVTYQAAYKKDSVKRTVKVLG